jgi:hypothetical protein
MMNRRFVLLWLLCGALVAAGCTERDAALDPPTSEKVGDEQGRGSSDEDDVLARKKAGEEGKGQKGKDDLRPGDAVSPGSPLDLYGGRAPANPPTQGMLTGESVYTDRSDWRDWDVDVQSQIGVAPYGKWMTFEPQANSATTPAFDGVREVRATFEVYFAPRFPLYSTPIKAGTELFSMHSGPHGSRDESAVQLAINMVEGNTWRIQSTYRDQDGDLHDSGEDYLTPWIFQHGWNRVDWIVLLKEPGAHQDAMRIQVGDRLFSWNNLDLSASEATIRHFTFGSWDVDHGQRHLVVRNLEIENVAEPSEEPPLPPPPPPPSGTVLYEEDFESDRPFAGWEGRNTRTNLQVHEAGGNHYGRLVYVPHSDWRISFLPRYQGVFNLRAEYSVRLPAGYRYERDANGEIINGGKHFWMLQSHNPYDEGREALQTDGQTRLDFGAWTEWGDWAVTAYRNLPGGGRPGEFARRFERGDYFTPGRWHRVRCDLQVNQQVGDDSGKLDLYIDGDHKGTFRGEFNVIGSRGGIRVLGFGNMDNCEGEPWNDVDDIRIEAR